MAIVQESLFICETLGGSNAFPPAPASTITPENIEEMDMPTEAAP
jgi:hypothetical protein